MGLWKLLKNLKALAVTDEKAWNSSLWNLIGSQSAAGVNVNEYTALTYSAVFNAINLISGTIAALPLHLYRREGKRKVFAENESAYGIMHDQWNEYMTAKDGKQCLLAHMLSWGNGYAEKVYNRTNGLVELWPVTPNRVRITTVNNELTYMVKIDNVEIPFHRDKILHVSGLGFDGFQGYSVIAMARQSIGMGLAMEEFGARYFGEGTHPGMIVKHPGKLSQESHRNLDNDLTSKVSGLGKSHRLLLLEEGMSIETLGIPPEDAQFLQSRQFQIPEIARWYNLPPHKLKDLTRSSFNNIESEQISFLTDSILPWLVGLEQQYNMQLLSPPQRKTQKLYYKHSFEGLLRAGSKDRAEYYSKMFSIGGMTINMILEKEDIDPIDHEFADVPFVPMNMVPLTMVREQLEKGALKPESEPKLGEPTNEKTEPQPVPGEDA